MISKSLLKKSGLYLIGNLSSKILSALLLPIYAFNVSRNDLGFFDFSQTIMGILSPLIYIAIWEAILKFLLSEEDQTNKRKILTTSAIFTVFMSIVFIFVAWIIINIIFEQPIKYPIIIISMIIVYSIAFIWQYYARAFGRNKLFVISGILSTIVNFIFVIVLVVFMNLGLLGLLIAYTVGQLSIIVFNEKQIGVFKNIKLKYFDFLILKKMLFFSAPLVLNLLSTWLISGFGKVIITMKLGTEANGIYSFSSRFALIVTMIGSVITMAMIEEAILSVKKNGLDKNFSGTIEGLFKVFQSITLLAVPAIVLFYVFLSETEYASSIVYAPWFLLYAIANAMASNIGSVFQAINKTKYQFLTTALGALITVIISISLIGKLGITAVIIGTIIGAISMMITRYIIINMFVELKINWIPIIFRTLLFISITILCLNTLFYVSILIELFLVLIIGYKNKSLIINVINKLKKGTHFRRE